MVPGGAPQAKSKTSAVTMTAETLPRRRRTARRDPADQRDQLVESPGAGAVADGAASAAAVIDGCLVASVGADQLHDDEAGGVVDR